jgi:hypothetical protein
MNQTIFPERGILRRLPGTAYSQVAARGLRVSFDGIGLIKLQSDPVATARLGVDLVRATVKIGGAVPLHRRAAGTQHPPVNTVSSACLRC